MKQIVKTKIIATKEQETKESKKKRGFWTAIAAGFGGALMASEQDKWGDRHKKTEEVYTFLVIYDDGSRETIEAVKNSEDYKKLILYIE